VILSLPSPFPILSFLAFCGMSSSPSGPSIISSPSLFFGWASPRSRPECERASLSGGSFWAFRFPPLFRVGDPLRGPPQRLPCRAIKNKFSSLPRPAPLSMRVREGFPCFLNGHRRTSSPFFCSRTPRQIFFSSLPPRPPQGDAHSSFFFYNGEI